MSSGKAGFHGRDIGAGFRFISDCQSSAKRFSGWWRVFYSMDMGMAREVFPERFSCTGSSKGKRDSLASWNGFSVLVM